MKKTVRRSNKFHAHDEKNEYSVGDLVWIEEHKPISKLKRWVVTQGEKRAKIDARSTNREACNEEKGVRRKPSASKAN